jgi:hypothetical protein
MLRVNAALACFAGVAAASIAHANTIDFYALYENIYPSSYVGTPVTNQYAGVVFSLQGGPDSSGPPTLGNSYAGVAVENTSHALAQDPTANILNMAFTSAVSGVSFSFTNFGTTAPTTFTAFNAFGAVVDTGSLQNVSTSTNCAAGQLVEPVPDCFQLVTVTGSGITDLQIDNNYGSNNWLFGVELLNFTPTVSTPEPSVCILLLAALLTLRGLRSDTFTARVSSATSVAAEPVASYKPAA